MTLLQSKQISLYQIDTGTINYVTPVRVYGTRPTETNNFVLITVDFVYVLLTP